MIYRLTGLLLELGHGGVDLGSEEGEEQVQVVDGQGVGDDVPSLETETERYTRTVDDGVRVKRNNRRRKKNLKPDDPQQKSEDQEAENRPPGLDEGGGVVEELLVGLQPADEDDDKIDDGEGERERGEKKNKVSYL